MQLQQTQMQLLQMQLLQMQLLQMQLLQMQMQMQLLPQLTQLLVTCSCNCEAARSRPQRVRSGLR